MKTALNLTVNVLWLKSYFSPKWWTIAEYISLADSNNTPHSVFKKLGIFLKNPINDIYENIFHKVKILAEPVECKTKQALPEIPISGAVMC